MKSKTKLLVVLWLLLAAPVYEAHGQSVILTWQDNSPSAGMNNAETGQRVWRQFYNDTTWSLLAEVGANAVTYTDNFFSAGNCYKVSAYNAAGETFSNVACSAPPPPEGPIFPQPPVNLVAQCNPDGTQAALSWSTVANSTSYAIRVNMLSNDDPGCQWGWLCSIPPDDQVWQYPGTSYVTTIEPGEPYFWWIHGLQGEVFGDAGTNTFTCSGPPPPGDTEPPTVTITNPLNGAVVKRKATVNIQLVYNDNVGVVETRYFINGSLLTNCGILTNSCNWSVPGAPHKTYIIKAEVRDAAGNLGSHQVTVTVP